MSALSTPQAELVWYIQAAERVWGPYRQARLASFVVEKRLTAGTLIATRPGGPFGPAGRRPELQRLFEPFAAPIEATSPLRPSGVKPPVPILNDQARTPSKPGREPAVLTSARPRAGVLSRKPPERPTQASAPLRALVVWADLASLNAVTFEATLADHGAFVGVRPGVWLIRSASEAAALRNALSRALTGEDALLILEAPLERAAWFNLDHEAEWNLRQLWGGANVWAEQEST